MTIGIWIAASLLIAGFGLATWRLEVTRRFDLPARLAIAFVAGHVAAAAILFFESVAGIPWTRASLAIPLLACTGAGVLLVRRCSDPSELPVVEPSRLARWWPIAAVVVLVFYGAATARMTCADLLYFWGPKAQRFVFEQKIDADFLRFPFYYLMHRDYPVLVPLTYVWSSIAAHRFSLWGAVLLAPLYLLATVVAFRGIAARAIGMRKATAAATLLGAILAFGFVAGRAAGGADPLLLMFEVVALSILTFHDGRGAHLLAGIALAGAVFTKVEGAAFAIVLIGAFVLLRRNLRGAVAVAIPPALLLGSWLLFAKYNNLLDSYSRGRGPIHLDRLGYVIYMTAWQASYRVHHLPWVAALAPLLGAVSWRRAALPLAVAAGSVAYTLFFYLHEAQPLWWIQASAERVLLTPLAAIVVATAAASE